MDTSLFVKYFAVVFLGGFWLIRCFRSRSAPSRRTLSDLHRDNNGASVPLDFVLTSMVFFPIIMCTLEFLFILNAYQFVKYSAFYAARSASVVIPERYVQESRNRLGNKKKDTIREAAAWAVSPVSPTQEKLPFAIKPAIATRYYKGIWAVSKMPIALGLVKPQDFARYDVWENKMTNALSQTTVKVFHENDPNRRMPADARTAFRPSELVTVEVTYKYCVMLPFAREILSDGPYLWDLHGATALSPRLPFPAATLRARCVAVNEGWGVKPTDFGAKGGRTSALPPGLLIQ